MIHLVLGGARSGKSSFAEQQCLRLQQNIGDLKPSYIATAQAFDEEMQSRIAKHKLDRSEHWQLIECPIQLSQLLLQLTPNAASQSSASNIYLIDCLTLWLNNIIYHLGDNASQQSVDEKSQELISALSSFAGSTKCHIVLVANEVGLGVVPLGKVSRLFVDNAGWLNQSIAKLADSVTLITAGLPLKLKGDLSSVTGDKND